MSSTQSSRPSHAAETAQLTPDQLDVLYSAEVFDEDGQSHQLDRITQGKRVLLVFIRHFWCPSCRAYIKHLSNCIPPESLPPGTCIIIIANGQYQPISAYRQATHTPYAIYAHPSLVIHKALDFRAPISIIPHPLEGSKAYEAGVGGRWRMFWTAVTEGLMVAPLHLTKVGPPGQHGGEVVLEADGTCSFIHRMEHGGDHTDLEELSDIIDASYIPMEMDDEGVEREGGKGEEWGNLPVMLGGLVLGLAVGLYWNSV
ncbi:uncharacterized protein MKK02DRAFT_42999 [Dioszegia hungarica]|uniref:Thioredoxin domain-containing protein n=1 Tax=Dioszegia hungarica TaxID=4972 RepID=A0AA38HDS6_9TREE|nr:uncharacterized protein MKK02DRAFT_42999 [Dioszegia hungarica]KAI9638601.1 hypothetical protein MKK02DRAFT_42999 [Dioszegia hungarica]